MHSALEGFHSTLTNGTQKCFVFHGLAHIAGKALSSYVYDIAVHLCTVNCDGFKGRLQSLLRMCDRFAMRSLLITSFQSHGVNENTRGRLNRSLLYCKERWRIKSWHKNCCFESFKIKQLILDSGNAVNRVA